MVKLIERQVLAAFEFGSAFPDCGKFRFGSGGEGMPTLEIDAPCFAQKLGTGAVFLLLDPLHLLRHFGRQGNGHCFGIAHGRSVVLLSVT